MIKINNFFTKENPIGFFAINIWFYSNNILIKNQLWIFLIDQISEIKDTFKNFARSAAFFSICS